MANDDMFASLPTCSRAIAFDNDKYFGIVVKFTQENFGLGEIAFRVSKKTGEVFFENEEMSMETCARIVSRLSALLFLSRRAGE